MATTTTQEEDRLVATAERIIKNLRTSKDVTDDMLLILSSFDNRLSNISKSIGCNSTIANAEDMSRLESDEKVILRHVHSCSTHLFDINSSVNESCEFLAAIDRILDLLANADADSTAKDDTQIISRAESVIQSAMSKLEDELRRILARSAIPLDVDNLHGSLHRVTLSFVSHDDDLIDKEFGSFDNQNFHERGGSIVGEVSLNLVNPDVISDLREIAARMIRGGYEKEYSRVYSTGRRDVLEEYLANLGFERLSIEQVHRIEWIDLDEKMKRWVQALKILVRMILTEEKRLCDQIIDESSTLIRDVCFVEAAKRCITHLLDFGEAVAIAKRSPEKLFRIFDMYEALSGTLPYIEGLFCNGSGDPLCSEAKGVLDSLRRAAKTTFLEFENAVKNETSKRPVIGGGIHPLARYVMNYVKLIVDYSETLNFLLEPDTKEVENQAQNRVESVDGDDQPGEKSFLGHNLRSLINSLELNLEEKAKYYDNRGMQYIFLMNNRLYIVQKVKDSELRELLGDGWIKRQRGIIRKCSMNYLRASWTKVLACLKDEGTGGVPRNNFKMSIKERFKNFNACFEEVYRTQTAWKVPDPQLRTELRISVSEKLIPAYRSFLGKCGFQLESGRNVGKYLKYTTEDLDAYLADLFEGTPCIINHMRRKSS